MLANRLPCCWADRFRYTTLSFILQQTIYTATAHPQDLKETPLLSLCSSPYSLSAPCTDEDVALWPWVSCACPSKRWETNKPQSHWHNQQKYEVHCKNIATAWYNRDTFSLHVFSFLPVPRWGCYFVAVTLVSLRLVGHWCTIKYYKRAQTKHKHLYL